MSCNMIRYESRLAEIQKNSMRALDRTTRYEKSVDLLIHQDINACRAACARNKSIEPGFSLTRDDSDRHLSQRWSCIDRHVLLCVN